jgi:DNA-binding MarR family transcriptional regulator
MNEWLKQESALQDTVPAANGAVLFGLLEAAGVLQGRISAALGRVGLSFPKYEVLHYLRNSKDPLSLGKLAECQHCARSNITQLVDRLEGEGLVRRIDDPSDRRSVLAEITPAGATLADQGAAQIEAVRAEFAACYSVDERAELARLLGRIE